MWSTCGGLLTKVRDTKCIKYISSHLWLMSLCIGLLGGLIGAFLASVPLLSFDKEVVNSVLSESGQQVFVMILTSGLYSFIITFIAYIVGTKSNKVLNFEGIKKFGKTENIVFYSLGIILPILLYVLDVYVYIANIQGFVPISFNLFDFISTVLYNGIIEEVWFRLGLVTFFSLLFYKVFGSKEDKEHKEHKEHKGSKLFGIIFASGFLFGFQLLAVSGQFGASFPVIIRAFINYFVMNSIYGYTYIKYGLKKSILLHVIFMVIYTGLCPIVFNIIYGV